MGWTWTLQTKSDHTSGFEVDTERSTKNLSTEVVNEFRQIEPLHIQLTSSNVTQHPDIAVLTWRFIPRLRSWVAIMQGSGNQYGPAGSVQFGLAPQNKQLTSVMAAALSDVREHGWLMPSTSDRPREIANGLSPTDPQRLASTLTLIQNLSDDRRYAVLPRDADGMSQLVFVAKILPEQVAQKYIWSTSFIPPMLSGRDQRVITTDWPAGLQLRQSIEYRELQRRAQFANLEPLISMQPHEGIKWVAVEASRGQFHLGETADCTTFDSWLEELDHLRPVDASEALRWLETGLSAKQEAQWKDQKLSARVLEKYPSQIESLLNHPARVVHENTLECLTSNSSVWNYLVVKEQSRLGAGEQQASSAILGLPIRDRIDFARQVCQNFSPAELVRIRVWLVDLGLRKDNAPDLFPATVNDIIQGLEEGQMTVLEAVRFTAHQTSHPVVTLHHISQKIPSLRGALIVEVLREMGPQKLDSFIRQLLSHTDTSSSLEIISEIHEHLLKNQRGDVGHIEENRREIAQSLILQLALWGPQIDWQSESGTRLARELMILASGRISHPPIDSFVDSKDFSSTAPSIPGPRDRPIRSHARPSFTVHFPPVRSSDNHTLNSVQSDEISPSVYKGWPKRLMSITLFAVALSTAFILGGWIL